MAPTRQQAQGTETSPQKPCGAEAKVGVETGNLLPAGGKPAGTKQQSFPPVSPAPSTEKASVPAGKGKIVKIVSLPQNRQKG